MPASSAHARFLDLARHLDDSLRPGEDHTLWLQGEESDFVRFNHGRVRQPGTVRQDELTLRLIRGQRHASADLTLSGEEAEDRDRVDAALARLRARVEELPEDPHLLWATEGESLTRVAPGTPPDGREISALVLDEAARDGGVDLVGVLVSGTMHTGFASSRGQRCWDQRHSWLFDWSLVHEGDKAVKSTVGGTDWQPELLRARMDQARATLPVLARPPRRLQPGAYKAWLTPAALAEVMDLLSWGAFSHRSQEARNTPLLRLLTGEASLDPRLTLVEDVAGGLAPPFTPEGFTRPAQVPLIDAGLLVGSLVSPRSSKEYGRPQNGASADESPSSIAMAPGSLPDADVLRALGTGLYISNLWYLNYSDRAAGRLTGMTRFATTWVEDGEVVAPTEVMRFDETIFHLLGEGLVAIGAEATLLPSTSTYERRATTSARLPGVLVEGMRFTL
jgi:predicted Zn-dependent protease